MADVPGADEFETSIDVLQDHLPTRWRATDPTSNLYPLLVGIGAGIDLLAPLYQQPFEDQVIATAGPDGLARNFAFALGLSVDQLPVDTTKLREYLQALLADDGSLGSLESVLTLLIDVFQPANHGGVPLTFPLDGSGLIFPVDGSGLTMYQYASGGQPTPLLMFPLDGSGLIFPADGSGLHFGTFAYVTVNADPVGHQLTVNVLEWLAFDRALLARTVKRFNPSDWHTPIINQVLTL